MNQDTVQQSIKNQIKDAMLAKDALRLSVLRGLASMFTNELVAKGLKPQEVLKDEDALAVIRRAIKQRKDSIEQFEKGGRADLAADEKAELAILETFVPAQMSKEDVEKVVAAKKAEMGADGADKTKMGLLMRAVMTELKGKADGMVVKEVVDSSFN